MKIFASNEYHKNLNITCEVHTQKLAQAVPSIRDSVIADFVPTVPETHLKISSTEINGSSLQSRLF